ncbi:MAG: hypothetical protein PHI93_09905 [Kiritimatiellae bacterium]|nr:hypothetical protein [Kiritimatiellia bacterium]
MTTHRPIALVTDANVLIDFVETDMGVLGLMAVHLFEVYVADSVLAEVNALTPAVADSLGLKRVSPTVQELQEAAQRGGPLSSRDRLCLVLARNRRWGCLTNDQALRRVCGENDIPVIWGLQVLLLLHEKGFLAKKRALQTAHAIHRQNPRHIHAGILALFEEKLALL